MRVLCFIFWLCFSTLWAHEQLSLTQVLFQTPEKCHAYLPGATVSFSSIHLQTQFLIAGDGLTPFLPPIGVHWLQTNSKASIFTEEKGFLWGDFQYPRDFEVQFNPLRPGEYEGKARSKPQTAPWFNQPFFLKMELRNSKGHKIQVFHEGKLQSPQRYVEYIARGLNQEKLEFGENVSPGFSTLIRAVIALESSSLTLPTELGKYQLIAEFSTEKGELLGKGVRYLEVVSETELSQEISLFSGISATPIMKPGEPAKIRLELHDSKGLPLTSPDSDYLESLYITLSNETSGVTMTDPIIRDFQWLPLPPFIKPQFPLEIPLSDKWLKFFGKGTLHITFALSRQYLKEEHCSVSTSCRIEF